MASLITNLKPPCGYNPGGIKSVRVLDWEDFIAFGFAGGALYDSALVTEIQRSGEFADVQPDVAKYSGPISGKIVNHTLETFVASMEAAYIAALHLASRRRYVVVFDGMNDRPYAFGYEAGAQAVYNGQTDGGLGYIVTFTCASIYPLFEVTLEALEASAPTTKWLPDFINGAFCEVQ